MLAHRRERGEEEAPAAGAAAGVAAVLIRVMVAVLVLVETGVKGSAARAAVGSVEPLGGSEKTVARVRGP